MYVTCLIYMRDVTHMCILCIQDPDTKFGIIAIRTASTAATSCIRVCDMFLSCL